MPDTSGQMVHVDGNGLGTGSLDLEGVEFHEQYEVSIMTVRMY